MSASNWQRCAGITLNAEGVFVANKHDKGGPTNLGVTQQVYWAWRKAQGLPVQSVGLCTRDEALSIYKAQYWVPIRGDELPSGLDLMVFTESIMSGPYVAVKVLQRSLGGLKADGHLGLLTMSALQGASSNQARVMNLIDNEQSQQLSWLRALSDWRYFGNGWRNRVIKMHGIAIGMAKGE